jgi:ABC-2 type transport system ATP-binding protein
VELHGVWKMYRQRVRSARLSDVLRNLLRPEVRVVEALRGIELTVQRGEVVAYAGPNGAGKSTTIKLLSGLLAPDDGRVTALGMDPVKDRVKYVGRIGVVFGQRTELWWDHPVAATFEWKRVVWDIPRPRYERMQRLVRDLLGLDEIFHTLARELSLGQRMRADLALALLHEPELLLLDEPTLGLDVLARRQILGFIRELNRERGVTVVVTSHDMAELEQLAGRIVMLHHGEIAFDGVFGDLRRLATRRRVLTLRPLRLKRRRWTAPSCCAAMRADTSTRSTPRLCGSQICSIRPPRRPKCWMSRRIERRSTRWWRICTSTGWRPCRRAREGVRAHPCDGDHALVKAYVKTAAMAAADLGDSPVFLLEYALRLLRVLILLALWRVLLGGRPNTAGVSLEAVLTYTVVAEVFAQQLAARTTLVDAFWQGDLVLRFLRPMGLVRQLSAEMAGKWTPNLLLFSLPLWLLAPLLGTDPRPASLGAAVLFVPSLALAIGVGIAIDLVFGALTVALEQPAWLLQQVRTAVSTVLSGGLLPLALYPWGIGDVFAFLPFAAMAWAPLAIYTGIGSPLVLLLTQVVWLVVLALLGDWMWRSNRERLVGYGG